MTEPTSSSPPSRHAARWRAATIACLLLMAIAIATGVSMFEQLTAQIRHLQTKLQSSAQIKYIAVLMDRQQTPAMLITQDSQDNVLQIQRLNSVVEGREDTMQLWALPLAGQPYSLGILKSPGKTLRMAADATALVNVRQLAISVENKGGTAPGAGPSLPYLFTGAVVQKAL